MIESIKFFIKKILFNAWYFFFRRYKRNSIFFITSTGRTGTNFFEHFFNSFDNKSYCIHEPRPDFFDLSMEKIRTNISSKKINKQIIIQRKRVFYDMLRKKKSVYIESNPFIYPILHNLKSVFSNSKYIIVTRDPKTYVQSALNKSPQDDGEVFFYSDEDVRNRIKATDFENDRYYHSWSNFNRLQKISWYWNKCNRILYNFYQKNRRISLYIRFEDLFSNDYDKRKETIVKILKFTNIQVSSKTLDLLIKESHTKRNKTKKKIHGKFEDWESNKKQELIILTQDMREKLNY